MENEKAHGRLDQGQVRLGCWGSVSWKPLLLKGSWPGLGFLLRIYELLYLETKDRQCKPISKPSGKCLGEEFVHFYANTYHKFVARSGHKLYLNTQT